jgi:flavin-binding protein dodecin
MGRVMAENSYAISEIVGSSKTGIDDAIRGAVQSAAEALHDLDWFEVTEVRGHIENNDVCHFQVTVKVGSRISEE